MGLTNWPNDNIRKSDVATSKNYLGQSEIKELNRLTSILLDIFEDQLDIGRLKTMVEAEKLLNKQLKDLNRGVLRSGGNVAMNDAKKHAERQYQIYKDALKKQRHANADTIIDEIKTTQKKLPKSR